MSARLRPVLLFGTSAALALGLSACKLDNRPLLARNDAAAPVDYAYAPGAAALPYAQPAQVLPTADAYDGYALAQRAYAHDRVAYREPPAYGFEYGDVEPWVWQAADDDLMFAEPVDDGYRFYYYEPGEAYPYFVRDPQYGYAYGRGGVLSALFDAGGARLPQERLYGVAPVAGRYLARGRDLRQVYYREPRAAVAAPVWTRRAPAVEAAQRSWIAAAERQPAFRDRRVAVGEPRAFERPDRGFQPRREDRRAFTPAAAPPVAPPPQFAQREVRGFHGRDRAPNAFQSAAPATARVDDRQVRDQHRQAMEQARANHPMAHNDAPPPQAFQRHAGGEAFRQRPAPQAAPQPQPQPQRQAFNAPHGGGGGGGGGHHQDRPAPAPAPSAPAAQPQPAGGDHGHHGGGGDKDRHNH